MTKLTISWNKVIHSIPFDEILFIERNNRKTRICTNTEEFYTAETINEIEKRLPIWFCRCHYSYLINLQKIRSLSFLEIELDNHEIIPISRKYTASTKKIYLEFISAN